jgi:hypothetical protein
MTFDPELAGAEAQEPPRGMVWCCDCDRPTPADAQAKCALCGSASALRLGARRVRE